MKNIQRILCVVFAAACSIAAGSASARGTCPGNKLRDPAGRCVCPPRTEEWKADDCRAPCATGLQRTAAGACEKPATLCLPGMGRRMIGGKLTCACQAFSSYNAISAKCECDRGLVQEGDECNCPPGTEGLLVRGVGLVCGPPLRARPEPPNPPKPPKRPEPKKRKALPPPEPKKLDGPSRTAPPSLNTTCPPGHVRLPSGACEQRRSPDSHHETR